MPRNPKVGDIAQGTAVPPSAHLVYFPSHANELELSPDGYHADEAPPEPFSQRVWAGARIEFNISNPLRVGEIASQTKSIESVQVKERQGADPLVVVGLTLAIQNTNGFSVTEFRDLIYMKPVHLQRRVLKYNRTPDFGHEIIPTEVLMFRYSALSWNSHRIHYDSVYARNVEHHPGLLVHGPLTCTLLLQLLQANMPNGMTLKTFDYRALSPLYCQQKMTLNGRWMKAMLDSADESKNSGAKACELWATNDEGGLAMKGVATIVPVAPNGQ
ncbi:hypothetical protein COEREDRAFT_37392 [Coemansia reversa NRRL 1564]|uniref:N-terminal of MaoC-like dehydratase domain-containing protein n=1 Tax=Coemansia reversa (strain ATCC 12441 / NRRL 1564) TaxID=763665 RepID=A0A2G5BK99_COERN|nr:hypothetical protein COEREDRAFT_37392 [Coemansia reversa NRRL 1564]|eukprot:PIA19167.1 hypothetical protein COEREDRAFT_37392 [Coemansia reversa NRRL 1564]